MLLIGKGIGQGVTGDGKAFVDGIGAGLTSVGTGVGQGVGTAVTGAGEFFGFLFVLNQFSLQLLFQDDCLVSGSANNFAFRYSGWSFVGGKRTIFWCQINGQRYWWRFYWRNARWQPPKEKQQKIMQFKFLFFFFPEDLWRLYNALNQFLPA